MVSYRTKLTSLGRRSIWPLLTPLTRPVPSPYCALCSGCTSQSFNLPCPALPRPLHLLFFLEHSSSSLSWWGWGSSHPSGLSLHVPSFKSPSLPPGPKGDFSLLSSFPLSPLSIDSLHSMYSSRQVYCLFVLCLLTGCLPYYSISSMSVLVTTVSQSQAWCWVNRRCSVTICQMNEWMDSPAL